MRKKIKKIICILSAVVIAFSCFSVSASETEYTPDDFFDSIVGSAIVVASLVDGSEELVLPVSSEIIGDTAYYTFKTDKNNPFFSSDYITLFAFDHTSTISSNSYALAYYLPSNISCDVESSNEFIGFDNLVYSPEYNFYLSSFPLTSTCCLSLMSSSDILHFTIAVRFSSDFNDFIENRPLIDNRSFYSDIKTFLGSSINWVTQIFKNLTKNPPTLILVICFSVVGFAYAMLYKFIGYKR